MATECAILTDKPVNPDSEYRKKLEHQDAIDAVATAISGTKGKWRRMKKELDEARHSEMDRQRTGNGKTGRGQRRRHARMQDTIEFKVTSATCSESIKRAVEAAQMTTAKHSSDAEPPAKQRVDDLKDQRIWGTLSELNPLMERRSASGNDDEMREWAHVALGQLTHADAKIKGVIRRRKKAHEDEQRSSNYRTALGEFFKSMSTRPSTGYHRTTAYVPHDIPEQDWQPDDRDDDTDETYEADTGYHAVTTAKAVGDAFRDAWRGVYSGETKPKPESAMYRRLFRNRASNAQRDGLRDRMRPATMEEFQAALELCNDRSAVGHGRSAYAAVQRATADVQRAMLAAINCCLKAGDIPDEWRHARNHTATERHEPLSVCNRQQSAGVTGELPPQETGEGDSRTHIRPD